MCVSSVKEVWAQNIVEVKFPNYNVLKGHKIIDIILDADVATIQMFLALMVAFICSNIT